MREDEGRQGDRQDGLVSTPPGLPQLGLSLLVVEQQTITQR